MTTIKRAKKTLIVVAISIVVLLAVCFILEKKFLLFTYIRVVCSENNRPDEMAYVDDLTDLMICLESNGYDNAVISYARLVDEKYSSLIIIDGVDSIDEATELVITVRDYFEENREDPLVIKGFSVGLLISNQRTPQETHFSNTYIIDADQSLISTIVMGEMVLPQMQTETEFDDVRNVYLTFDYEITDEDIANIREVYPNARIIH